MERRVDRYCLGHGVRDELVERSVREAQARTPGGRGPGGRGGCGSRASRCGAGSTSAIRALFDVFRRLALVNLHCVAQFTWRCTFVGVVPPPETRL